jgi:diguanylate cyclase (GGDEF)-like protein
MYRVLSCLTNEHNAWLVGLAVVVCVATALTTFLMYSIACTSRDRRKLAWAALTGVCAGSGIWATHFVAMLAYQGGLPTYYEPVATLGSLLVAVVISACGFALATRGGPWFAALGGLVLGTAIGSMHYLGMRALIVPGVLNWDYSLVIASLLLGGAFATAALLAFRQRVGTQSILLAGGLLVVAICALHFTAMGAATISLDPTLGAQGDGIERPYLALAIAGVTFIVLSSALAAAAIQGANLRYETVLQEQNKLFEAALRHLPVGLSMFDSKHRLIVCNPAYRRLYDLTEEKTPTGVSFKDIVLDYVKQKGGEDVDARLADARNWIDEHVAKLRRGEAFTETMQLEDGRSILKKVAPTLEGGWVDVQEDVSALRKSDHKIEWLARHDALTGIANRFQFRERLERQFQCYDPRLGFALHWIDLDYFKEVNDQYGHQVGDGYLKSVAHRLSTSLRAGDLVGRLGGDEFAILQLGGGKKELAEQFAARLLTTISQPHDVLGHKLTASASIGIALVPQHARDPDELFTHADAALYNAKQRGRGIAVLYDPGSTDNASAPNPLRAELQQAVDRGELVLHYQPIVDLRAQKVSGFEALMRWKHPSRGMIPPGDFISIAEETRQIVPMGTWALNQACADAMCWPEEIGVSVNISPLQIEGCDLHEVVTKALKATDLSPHRLQLEITETALMHDSERTQATLRKLVALGVTISLDDFGTRFATFNHLRSFPFGKIKIDRSFIHDVASQHDNLAIMRSMADLASELNIVSVAEGVETAADLVAVRLAGYDEAQGFYFSLPVPARGVDRAVAQCLGKFEEPTANPGESGSQALRHSKPRSTVA